MLTLQQSCGLSPCPVVDKIPLERHKWIYCRQCQDALKARNFPWHPATSPFHGPRPRLSLIAAGKLWWKSSQWSLGFIQATKSNETQWSKLDWNTTYAHAGHRSYFSCVQFISVRFFSVHFTCHSEHAFTVYIQLINTNAILHSYSEWLHND